MVKYILWSSMKRSCHIENHTWNPFLFWFITFLKKILKSRSNFKVKVIRSKLRYGVTGLVTMNYTMFKIFGPPGTAARGQFHMNMNTLYLVCNQTDFTSRYWMSSHRTFPLTSLCPSLPPGIACLSTEHFHMTSLCPSLPPGIACLSTEHFHWPLYVWLYLKVLNVFPQNISVDLFMPEFTSRYCMSFHRTFSVDLFMILPPGIACLSTEHFRRPLYAWLTLPQGIACLSTEHFRWPLYAWLYLQVLHVFPQNISVDLFMSDFTSRYCMSFHRTFPLTSLCLGLCSIVFFNRRSKNMVT